MTTLFEDHITEAKELGTKAAIARHQNDENLAQFLFRHLNKIAFLYTLDDKLTIIRAYEDAYKAESQSYPNPGGYR